LPWFQPRPFPPAISSLPEGTPSLCRTARQARGLSTASYVFCLVPPPFTKSTSFHGIALAQPCAALLAVLCSRRERRASSPALIQFYSIDFKFFFGDMIAPCGLVIFSLRRLSSPFCTPQQITPPDLFFEAAVVGMRALDDFSFSVAPNKTSTLLHL